MASNCQHHREAQEGPCRVCQYIKPRANLVKAEKYYRTQEDRDTKRAIAEKERKFRQSHKSFKEVVVISV